MPWYLDHLQAGERYHVPPWETIDEPTPRWFWVQVANIVSAAEAAARRKREAIAQHMAHVQSMQGG